MLLITNVATDVIVKSLETNAASFLAGVLVGVFMIVKWLDIPDKILEIDSKILKILNRQKHIYEIAKGQADGKKTLEEFYSENN